MSTVRFLYLLVPAAFLVLGVETGCISTETTSGVADALDSLGVSLRSVREMNVRFAYRDGLAIEQAADSIIAATADQTVRLEAYRWKIYSIPVIRQVYAQNDPIASRIDALAFSMQSDAYLRTGIGRDRFGIHQDIALAATAGNLRRIREATRSGITEANYDSIMSQVTRWATNHPLTNHVFERPSIIGDMQPFFATQDYSIGSAVGRIADDVDDLSGRLSVFAAQLPREARWQGEVVLEDLALKQRLATLDSTVAVLTASLQHIEQGVMNGNLVVDIASLRSLHADLRAALELVRTERVAVLADIDRQRVATLEAVEQRVEKTVISVAAHVDDIVGRVLWKMGVGFVAGLAVAILIAASSWRRTRKQQLTTDN